jgi:hypothetical protein
MSTISGLGSSTSYASQPVSAMSRDSTANSGKESFVIEGELSPWEQLELAYLAAARGIDIVGVY